MGVFGQLGPVWWLDLLLVNLAGLLLGGLFASLRARKVHLAALDAVHHQCWAEQDRWLEEHEAQSVAAEQARREALYLAQVAVQERDQIRGDLEQAMERVRREMDGARVGYCKAEQALCQQLLSMERQVAAERTAHRREVQALRVQCDEFGELLATERQTVRVDAEQHRQVCASRDNLRQEVGKLLDLLEQSDTAQAALQHRANVLEQQMVLGQRQLEEVRQALERERTSVRMPLMRPVAQAALTTITTAAPAANAHPPSAPGACELRPFERQPDSPPPDNLLRIVGIGPSNQTWLNRCGVWYLWQIAGWKAEEQQWVAGHLPRFGRRVYRENWVGQAKALLDEQRRERRVYPALLPPGAQDRRVNARQREALAAA
jgi:predicted flap endonuclease-1-like 5' DNA nuclease